MFWQSARMQSPLRRVTNTTEDGINLNPSISGDGRFVGFESTEDVAGAGGEQAFRAIRANVSIDPASFLQMGSTRAPAPGISQDGSRITFASKDDPIGSNADHNSEIFLYDGAKLIQVTNTSPGDISNRIINGNFQPSISDDGRYIAFSSNRQISGQNTDGNLEIYVYDVVAQSFAQLTNSTGVVGSSDAKISGDGNNVAYINDNAATVSTSRRLLLQSRNGLTPVRVIAAETDLLALTYGRAISDDGARVVWSARTAANTTQVFLFDGRNGNTTRQITALGSRATDVPLHPTISGDGTRIAFATRRAVPGQGANSDSSVELYTYDIPSGTFGRVTNVNSSGATADVVSSMNDDGSVIAFNFPRLLSGPVSNDIFANDSEIYLSGTPPRPTSGTLTILNRASFGHEPSTTKAVAPDSIAVALGGALAFTTEQAQRRPDGSFPFVVAGTTVTVNGQPAQIFFVSPTEVHFHVPVVTVPGTAEVVVTNSDGFQSRGTVTVLTAAPGVFTKPGDGLGEGMIVNADTLEPGPFDPSSGNLRLLIFATGVRNGVNVSVTAGGRALTVESIVRSQNMPGLDEIHVLVPADLRGVGKVDLVVRADGRDSNPVTVEFSGTANRDVLINEFLADPPDGTAGDANRDGTRDASQDEFIELVNTTTHDIDISGYRILTRGTGSDTLRHTFAAGTILRSCTAIVVFGGGTASFNPNDPAFGGAQVVKASSGGLSLVNGGGSITVQDAANTIVNVVAYGGSTGLNADNNQSLTRSPDISGDFAQHLTASGGARAFSPGTQLNGAPFSSCATAVARVEVSPSSATINVGAQQQFTAKAFDAGNNEVPGVIFSWQSSDTNVATIDQNGLATGKAAGSTEIRATGRGVQSGPSILTVNAVAPPNVVINEVDSDQNGTDTTEFVEVYDGGTGNTSLSGLVIVFYNGGDDKSYAAFDLDGLSTNAGGYFTLGNAAVPGVDLVFADGLMQNGPDAVAIYVGNASDFPNATSVTTTNLIDALVYDTSDADDPGLLVLLNSGQPQVNEDNGGNGTVNSNQRCPNGSGGPRNTSTYNQFAPTPDGANVCMVTNPPPTLTINDVSMNEGNAGATTFTFTVSLSAPAPTGGITFDIGTADNTATVANNDYVAKSLTGQTIAAGNQTYQFTVTVNGDTVVEPNETFFVNVTNVTGATVGDGQGLGTIVNDDSPTLSINDVSANEGNSGSTTFTFTVTSSLPAPAGGITFDIATTDGPAQDGNPVGEDNDYVAKSLTGQTITAGNTTYTFDVTVNGDTLVEGNETFFVNVTNASGATVADGQGQGTILNDDGAILVISQVYAGGGNTGAQYTNDFVEIYNHGATSVNFATTPYSVQYAAATSTTGFSKVDLTSGSLAPGQYFLIQLGGGANGAPLPTPDATGTIAMAATAGKVALVAGTTALTGSGCPLSATVADFVGYGTTANCFEGAGPAPAPSNTTADFRKAGGCVDTNNNNADFFVSAPFPRNTSSPLGDCAPEITINDVTVTEGNTGTVNATFTVTLAAPSANTVSVNYATADGTATAPADYQATSGMLTFTPGQVTQTITVPVNGDLLDESNETFFVNLSGATNGNIIDNQGQGTITDNDPSPSLSINDVTVTEGDVGVKSKIFTVTLSTASGQSVTVAFATADGTASAPGDYRVTTGTLTFNPGETTQIIEVLINGDTTFEQDETFFVNLTAPTNATISDSQGVGTITNDDPAPVTPTFVISDVSVFEGNSGQTNATFTVTLSPASNQTQTVDFATTPVTATAGSDYQTTSGTLTFLATETSKTIDVPVNGDTLVEPDEAFAVNLTNASPGATIGTPQATGFIWNDDMPLLVISQVYAGGGNTGAQYTNDFVELFNRGTSTVDFAITAYSVQYAAATSTSGFSKLDLTSGSMAPGQYFLVQLGGGANGAALPTPDATGTIAMAATAGKVALVRQTNFAMTGSGCPLNAMVTDFVGYGTTANCFEGSGPAPAPSNTTADLRKNGGCIDTNDNAADFLVSAPFPRNSSSPFNNCVAGNPPNLTINDVTVAEGNSGTTIATFTVSLSAPAPATDITFDIATQDNTATTANGDYVAKTLTNQVIPAGQQTYTFTVAVNGDTAVENNETFFVNVTNPSGATITDGQGVGTIQNDDLPALSINDVNSSEGNAGTKLFSFTVSLSTAAPTGGVTFDIATQDNTATVADNDYVAKTLTSQTIPAGSSTYNFDVTVNGDVNIEPNETFLVNVTNVSGATVADGQGTGTIQNDDSPSLSIDDVSHNEGNSGTTTYTFTVTSSLPAPAGGITFDIGTQDDTATAASGDYVSRTLTGQTITAGNTTYTFDVAVNGDLMIEPNETFFVNITNASGADISDASGTGTILNDDIALIVISQIYGGGNNSGATFQNDFVELFNRGTATVSFAVTPFSVQYASAGAAFTSGNTINLTTGSLAPGQYFLISLAGGTTNGVALPPADASNTAINMSATDGKVALVAGTTLFTGTGCPTSPAVADFIGYGSANCAETTATAALSATKSARRTNSCIDTNNNAADFTVVTNPAAPRNSASPLNDCNAPPNLTIDNVSVTEGNSGPVIANFTVTLSSPAPAGGVTFDIGTQDNTATTADNDYVARALTSQTITAGNTTYSFAVTVNGDTNVEADETFFVNVTNVTGASVVDGQGLGTILNDDSAALPGLSIDDVSMNEGNSGTTTFTFTVSLTFAAPAGGVTFDIATADNTATVANNDYQAKTLTAQTIAAGNQTYQFTVAVNGDANVEPNETFFVNVTNVTGATVTDGQGQGTIVNDDSAATPGAIVISQIYGGGGNTGAPLLNDFIELFNRGGAAVDVAGWSVQYSAATATTAFSVTPICPTGPCLIQPGKYFLVKEASGGAVGAGFTADVTGTINLSATAGRVVVVNNTTALVGNTACGSLVSSSIDFVGYGATANCFEGTGPTAAPSNTTAVLRAANGCTDTNVNSADFAVGAPNPRNSSSAQNLCAGPEPPPAAMSAQKTLRDELALFVLRSVITAVGFGP
jgi:hypothetical protein